MATDEASSLPELDDSFHRFYDRTRGEQEHRAPVLVVVGDNLFFYRNGARDELPITSAPAQILKAAAHVPVGVFLVARRLVDVASFSRDAESELRRLLLLCRDRRGSRALPGADLERDVASVLDRCVVLLEEALATGRIETTALRSFARELGPRLLHLAEEATRLQLSSLDQATQRALAPLSTDEREALRVVVAGAHQARVRSLPMQYFQKLLGETAGREERVLFAESVTDPAEARALVGTNLLDREIADAFFGDPQRLQRDVLGDITTAMLASDDASPP